MHLDCPHCRNRIDVALEEAKDECLCPSCGSTIQLKDNVPNVLGHVGTRPPDVMSFQIDVPTTSLHPEPARSHDFDASHLGTPIESASPEPVTLPTEPHRALSEPRSIPGYEVLGELGRGGMGVVYKARQVGLNRVVALKMILAGAHARPDELARFRREAEAVAQLQHLNVVQIHEIGERDGLPYFSLEYVTGGSLAQHLDGTPWPGARAAALVETLARTMDAAHHHGIIHRDLKPANILLQPKSDARDAKSENESRTAESNFATRISRFEPKISDFGLAKRLDMPGGVTQSNAIVGTPSYMAPEQAAARGAAIGPAADVYALGAILYELLTGRPPFRAETPLDTVLVLLEQEPVPPRRLQPKIHLDLETICLKCLEKEPRRRYESAQALAEDLGRFQKDEPILARPVGRIERGWRWCRRNPGVASLGAALSLVMIGAFASVTSLWLLAEQRRTETQTEKERTEDQRVLADENFRQARNSVDEYFTRISENKLLFAPGLQPLRKDLLETALKYYESFVRQRQDDPNLQTELAHAHFRVGQIRSEFAEYPLALNAFQRASSLREQLLEDDPSNPQLLRDLALTYDNIGFTHTAMGKPEEALPFQFRSRDIRQGLVRDHPDQADFLSDLGGTLSDLGITLEKLERPEVLQTFQQAISQQRRALKIAPGEARYRLFLANHYAGLAHAQLQSRQPAQALESFEQARSLYADLAREQPGNPLPHSHLGAVSVEIATLHQLMGHLPEALRNYQRAQNVLEVLAAKNPAVFQYQLDLADFYERLGGLQRATGDSAATIRTYEKARDKWEQVIQAFPNQLPYRAHLGGILNDLGFLMEIQGRREDALASYQRAIAHERVAFDRQPQGPPYRQFLSNHYLNLARVQRDLGRPAEAAAASLERQKLWPSQNNQLYEIACELAECVSLVGKGHPTLTAEEQAQRQRYGDQALAALQQAVAHGFKNASRIEKDARLAPLQSRADFRKLVADLNAHR